jgi:predicted transcriptional regulator
MAEKPIKVDEQTDRIVTDLAHFLRSTKKSVVRDAVAEYAASRHALMATHTTHAVGAGGLEAEDDVAAGIDGLSPMERLALRRKELIREFARHRGTNIRVLEASDDDEDDEITLLVETDVIDGAGAAPRLAHIATRLLATHVTVISTTGLRLLRPESHRRALAQSYPL